MSNEIINGVTEERSFPIDGDSEQLVDLDPAEIAAAMIDFVSDSMTFESVDPKMYS